MTDKLTRTERKVQERTFWRMFGNAFFYLALIAIFVFALVSVTGSGGNRPLWGFFFYEVMTDSMEGVMPKGSLVVVQEINTDDIEIDDDITFFTDENVKVTHRVVGIIENYEQTGQRGFETKGVSNTSRDEGIVHAQNVVGKVVFVIPVFGDVMMYIRQYWYLPLIPSIGLITIVILLKTTFRKEDRIEEALPDIPQRTPSPATPEPWFAAQQLDMLLAELEFPLPKVP